MYVNQKIPILNLVRLNGNNVLYTLPPTYLIYIYIFITFVSLSLLFKIKIK